MPLASADIARHDLMHSQKPDLQACAHACCSEPRCGGLTFVSAVSWASSQCPLGSSCCFLKDQSTRQSDVTHSTNVTSALRVGSKGGDIPKGGGLCGALVDCNGGGDCIGSRCRCDATWTGPWCEHLHVLPIDARQPGFPVNAPGPDDPDLPTNNTFTWGGALAKEGGVYHLFFTEWLHHCPMTFSTFVTSTHIAHATAPTATGPWTRAGVAVPPAAGNPAISRAPDGEWLLYYTNHRWNGTLRNCTGPVAEWGMPSHNPAVSLAELDIILFSWENFDYTVFLCPALDTGKQYSRVLSLPLTPGCCQAYPFNKSDVCGRRGYGEPFGISLAHSKSLDGPWDILSDVISIPATNPGGPVFLSNGALEMFCLSGGAPVHPVHHSKDAENACCGDWARSLHHHFGRHDDHAFQHLESGAPMRNTNLYQHCNGIIMGCCAVQYVSTWPLAGQGPIFVH
eukprot:SAG31_NODE_651_length_13184_cov_4.999541_7_plen_454_part_00